jgi:TetR/AcrR family tetracycline transcriptional repressor
MVLPFRSPAQPNRRRKSFLTQAEIIAVAADILNRDGFDALHMRSVAAELGVQAAALYRHVSGRAELVDLLFDHLMADCAPKVGGKDWRDDLAAVASAWRRRLVTCRDATRIALGQVSIGPNVAPLMEAALDALRRSGLCDRDVVEAFEAYLVFVHGFASEEASHRDLAPDARMASLRPEWASSYPALSKLAKALSAPPDFDAHFGFALEALIAGIEHRLQRSRRAKPKTSSRAPRPRRRG